MKCLKNAVAFRIIVVASIILVSRSTKLVVYKSVPKKQTKNTFSRENFIKLDTGQA